MREWRSAVLFLALLTAVGVLAGAGRSQPAGPSCSAAQKAQRQQAARTFAKKMAARRAAYFKTHRSFAQRSAFSQRERRTLAKLRRSAACVVPQPVDPTTTTTTTTTTTIRPVATQETFVFGPDLSQAGQDEVRNDIRFAAQDEAALVGVELTSVSTFAATSPAWLAEQECRFNNHNDDGCLSSVRKRWESGASTAVGGPGAIFLDWANPNWGYGAGSNQKILAHELFHVLQYQLDKLLRNGETPADQVRASGPVWLDEGAPETIGYHVAADGRFFQYANVLSSQIGVAKQIGVPLDALQTRAQGAVPNVYTLYHVAVDHLVSIAPGGLSSLATYYTAIGNGAPWPAAFTSAFGLSVEAYYANFAAYRATL